eukprot:TRINITY_DN2216_c0_g1_i1.p1 TRINITY_DN2216_c0_g1~~TRINITY_DN2216_c0_g1_i1.p1  ORF type:complete len:372 (+),score=97.75 TRINITY_DN2216_c0_g1_i1:450-1565(+)
MLKDTVSKFAKEKIAPFVSQMEQEKTIFPSVFEGCFDMGLMGVEVDPKYGGNGMGFMSSILTIEELAKVDSSVAVAVDIQNTLVNRSLRLFGTEEQKEKYLPRLTSDTLSSFCLSEPGSGSDAFAMKTRASKDNDNYIINGSKCWISTAREAGLYLVFANIDPEGKSYKGITAFLVDKENPGIKIGKNEDKLGLVASSTCEVIFDNCIVSKDAILGEIGKGYKVAIELLNEGRVGIAAQQVGLAQGVFDHTIPYIKQRKQFNQAISSFQGVQFDVARLATEIQTARVMTYNTVRMIENNDTIVREASMAKLYASQMAERVSSKCIELLGGVGFTKDFPVEKYYRDCKVGQIYEGTTNIQLSTIAKSVLNEY